MERWRVLSGILHNTVTLGWLLHGLYFGHRTLSLRCKAALAVESVERDGHFLPGSFHSTKSRILYWVIRPARNSRLGISILLGRQWIQRREQAGVFHYMNRTSSADVNQGLQSCQQTTESQLLLMASPGKKRPREKVIKGLFAEVGEQLQLPFTVPQSCGAGLETLKAKPAPGVAWDEATAHLRR